VAVQSLGNVFSDTTAVSLDYERADDHIEKAHQTGGAAGI